MQITILSLLELLCKRRSLFRKPPLNLALKNLCEGFLLERTERPSAGPAVTCSVQLLNIKLFCLNHLQPLCVICLRSKTHSNHSVRPINEAAHDYKEGLREILKPLQEILGLFSDIKKTLIKQLETLKFKFNVLDASEAQKRRAGQNRCSERGEGAEESDDEEEE